MLVAFLAPQPLLFADTLSELRLSIGSKLFPSMLAADLNIKKKQDGDGVLQLFVVYKDFPHIAEIITDKLAVISDIKGMPLRVTPISLKALVDSDIDPVAGIFLAEELHADLAKVIAFARKRKVMVFSPHEGDVEQGAHGGILVRDHILPYINSNALQVSGIQLKAFFLKVAEQYE
ncbi:MAG: hypothetical protein ABFS08_13400 [Pseudomonadota bacterium]